MTDHLRDAPKRGDVHGDAYPGHRADRLWALVVVQPDGSEGLASMYSFDRGGEPCARSTFVASHPATLAQLKRAALLLRPPPGGRLEWREYTAATPPPRQVP